MAAMEALIVTPFRQKKITSFANWMPAQSLLTTVQGRLHYCRHHQAEEMVVLWRPLERYAHCSRPSLALRISPGVLVRLLFQTRRPNWFNTIRRVMVFMPNCHDQRLVVLAEPDKLNRHRSSRWQRTFGLVLFQRPMQPPIFTAFAVTFTEGKVAFARWNQRKFQVATIQQFVATDG